MLFGLIVQKVLDTNLEFRFQRVENLKNTTIIIFSFKIDNVKVDFIFFRFVATYLVPKINWDLPQILFGQKFPNAAIVQ